MAFLASIKVALVSTGVLSAGIILKHSVPVVTDFAASELPLMYSFVNSWLQPPYLYLIVNCIIITIVASSKFQVQAASDPPSEHPELMVPPPMLVLATDEKIPVAMELSSTDALFVSVSDSGGAVATGYGYQDLNEETVEKFVVDENTVPLKRVPQRTDSIELLFQKFEEKTEKEKPSVSARFRKAPTPEGGRSAGLGVSRQKRHDTLETTWKTITDGRPIPLARHLKKSDTWDTPPLPVQPKPAPVPSKMTKSETISSERDGDAKPPLSSQGSGKLKKEASLSQDELNKRVEAFIKKFNEEMRLQREESLNQHQERISRGAYF